MTITAHTTGNTMAMVWENLEPRAIDKMVDSLKENLPAWETIEITITKRPSHD